MTDKILFHQHDGLAVVTLNRPSALNAQDLEMVSALRKQLALWQGDESIAAILIRGAGEKAFCAGGDIKALWQDKTKAEAFFEEEYQLCYELAHSRKPIIAYMDGITMGGGVGLSIFAAYRLATENTVWAMPETAIGFFPDIAASYFLPRLKMPGLGRFLGLTGARLKGADCVAAGIATHYVQAGLGDELVQNLAASLKAGNMDALQDMTVKMPDISLQGASWLEEISTLPLPAYEKQLRGAGLWPEIACDFSIALTDAAMAIGARLSHAEVVGMDKRLAQHFLAGATFPEGVRARLVDKDNKPNWPAFNFANDAGDITRYLSDMTGK